jgi:ubiquinone biosynthesis protein UbiJ
MNRLDCEETVAKEATRMAVSALEVEEYLADVPALYDAAEPLTQKRILQALFERIEVLGPNQLG